MKQQDIQTLAHLRSTAPALTRGLAAISLLSIKPSLKLEEIAQTLKLPKASVLRLMESLRMAGFVRRAENKHYELLWILQPVENVSARFRNLIKDVLPALASRTACSAEWYEPSIGGMELILQEHSKGELQVRARPGLVRPWESEIDVVSLLGYAFDPAAPAPVKSPQTWVADGKIGPISLRQAKRLITDARKTGFAQDMVYNCNGVRRFAVAVSDGEHFRGVLAVADCFQFRQEKPQPEFYFEQLTRCLPKT